MKRVLGALVVLAALITPAGGAQAVNTSGWVPVPWVRYALNPTATMGPDNAGDVHTDRVFPTVMRVDDKVAHPLGRFYLWVWRHGGDSYVSGHSGRLRLFTADRLDSNWIDRGWVTPDDGSAPGWGPYSNTGGDVVWSAQYQKFFSVPHSHNTANPGQLSTFLWESPDGVNWSRSSDTPILSAGPEWYDSKETGYGKLLLDPNRPAGTEHWIWLYRSGYPCSTCPNNAEFYTFSVARADDIHGPWVKDANNPAYTPSANGGLVGLNGFVYYEGTYQMIWQDSFGDTYLSRSRDLHTWEEYADANGQRVPIFASGGGPHEAIVTGGDFKWDNVAAQWSYVYLSWDAQNLQGTASTPGHAYVNLARGVGGHP
jgi:hypothetical protein